MKYTIEIPLPFDELNPNKRPHYMAKARKVKQYREWSKNACLIILSDMGLRPAGHLTAAITIRYYHRTMNFKDPDNAKACLKSAIDGITDSGIIADDNKLTYKPVEQYKDATRPRVEIDIESE